MDTVFKEILQNPAVVAVAKAFRAADAEIALVGGVVRDALSGKVSDDLDFTTNLRPSQIAEVLRPLGTLWEAGARFGTIAVSFNGEKVEVTTYREETYQEDSRKPEVRFGDSLLDDLTRRDLTINALALSLDVEDGRVVAELVDPTNGADDLLEGVLRTPSDPVKVISDDPLRAIRAVRFAALRGMRIDPSLQAAIGSQVERMKIVARERKLNELEKLLKEPHALSKALKVSSELGVDAELFGGLNSLKAAPALSRLDGDRLESLLVLAVFADDGEQSARELRLPNQDVRWVRDALKVHSQLSGELSIFDARRVVRKAPRPLIESVFKVLEAQGKVTADARSKVEQAFEEGVSNPLPVNGDDALMLGLKGPEIRLALMRVEEKLVLDGHVSREEALKLLTV